MGARERFERYMAHWAARLGHADRHAGLRGDSTGLILPGPRKSVEPMAARVDPLHTSARLQALHHFVAQAEWSDEERLRRVAQWAVPKMDGSAGGFWSDTALPKKGKRSVGVAQHCGVLGKQDNCQVAVGLSLANAQASVPVAWPMYLPKEWAREPARRHKAGVPAEVKFATKTELVLAQRQALLAQGAPRHCELADAGYGVDTAFRSRLSDLGLPYVVGITSSVVLWPPGVEPLPPRYGGRGRPPVMPRRTPRRQPMSVKALARALPASGLQTISWRQGTNATLSGRYAAVRVRHAGGNAARARLHPEQWLLIEWPAGDAGPLKYFLSNLPADTAPNDLVAQAHPRWRIRRDDQDPKQEIGLGHYEGRGWRGLHHHAALTLAAYGFRGAERLAAGRANGAKKTFIARQVPALPADDLPRGGPARAAARVRFQRDDPPPVQRSTHPSPRPLPARRPATRKTTFVTQED